MSGIFEMSRMKGLERGGGRFEGLNLNMSGIFKYNVE
jgi:hypothetical protein